MAEDDIRNSKLLGILVAVSLLTESECPSDLRWKDVEQSVIKLFPIRGSMMEATMMLGQKLGIEVELGSTGVRLKM